MKGHFLASVAVAALTAAGPALAADLPLKAPPPAVAAWSWSGFYIGGHGGYGWAHDALSDVNDPFFTGKFPGFVPTGFDPKGFLGGLQAGANWQSGAIVAGLEGDLSFTDIKGSSLGVPTPVVTTFPGPPVVVFANTGSAANSGTFELLGSGRARLGYLATPNILLYGTGGLGWTRFVQNTALTSVSTESPPFPSNNGNFTSTSTTTLRFGWVAGLGVESRLFDTNWLARLEYLHYDFGNSGRSSTNAGPGGATSTQSSGDLTADIVRAGLSYKFDPFIAGAGSADQTLSYKAPAPMMPWTWSGYYLGAHAGYGWGNDPINNLVLASGIPSPRIDSRGFVGGFQAGANWQSGSFVGGLEIDLSGTGVKGTASNTTNAGGTITQTTQTDKLDWFGSARARIGYLVSPGVLLYGTGGPGWARLGTSQDTVANTNGVIITTSTGAPNWLFGWVAGAGVEARLGQTNWLARVEYLHYDFGSSGFTQTIPAGGGTVTGSTSGRLTNDLVRVGLGYKFDWIGYAGGGHSAMPVKAASAAVWSWSGFYIGGHGGYGWGRDPGSNLVTSFEPMLGIPATFVSGPNSRGFVGGFQAGANWQDRSVVGGLEIDLSGSDIKGSSSAAGFDTGGGPVTGTHADKIDLLGSARARLGYLVWPNVLLYGTGGLGWTKLDQTMTTLTTGGTTITSTPSWRFGWVAGAGGEARISNTNWLVRLEYLHYDFGNSGSSSTGFTSSGALNFLTGSTMSQHLTADVVRAGLGYKFD